MLIITIYLLSFVLRKHLYNYYASDETSRLSVFLLMFKHNGISFELRGLPAATAVAPPTEMIYRLDQTRRVCA